MDSFEFNKIAGAILGTALFVMALSIVSEIIYEPVEAHERGYQVALADSPATGAGGVAAAASGPVAPISVRMASANVTNGESVGKKCLACHTLSKDQPAKVGPNLWSVVGGSAAHQPGFKYSDAMLMEKARGLTWTFENLDQFLAAPKMFMPGTAMAFVGLPKPDERADMIAYLRTLADNPVPLPTTAAATSGAASAPRAGPAPAGSAPAGPAR
jgi:cytochrome c